MNSRAGSTKQSVWRLLFITRIRSRSVLTVRDTGILGLKSSADMLWLWVNMNILFVTVWLMMENPKTTRVNYPRNPDEPRPPPEPPPDVSWVTFESFGVRKRKKK